MSLLLYMYFKERRRRPVTTILDEHVCKTKTNDFGGALNICIN